MNALIISGVVVFFGGIIFLAVYFSKSAIIKRALKKAPLMQISQFMGGETGRVTGKVALIGEVLEAPLSKRRCSYYNVTVEEYRSNGKSGSWRVVLNEERAGDIVVAQGNQYALIDKSALKSYLIPDSKFNSAMFKNATPELEAFLQSRGLKSTGLIGLNKTLRYNEGILEEHELVTVSGIGNWSNSKPAGVQIPSSRYLYITPGEKAVVYLTDDPKIAEA